MKKRMTALVAGVLLMALTLTGCSMQGKQLSGVEKITYAYTGGHTRDVSMFVFTSDYTLKHYKIMTDSEVDLLAGELPPDNEYTVTEYQISEEEWNALIDVLNENRFAQLPEDISIEGFDMPSTDIQVETADGVYKSGGYGAGHGDDRENKRFHAIQEELDNIIKAHKLQF